MTVSDTDSLPEVMQRAADGTLVDLLGIQIVTAEPGRLTAQVEIRPEHLAPHGYLHAGTVVTLADTCAGMGCIASLPEHAQGFTTIELNSNFIRSAKAGAVLLCEASLARGGRTIQVWEARVTREHDHEVLALFRCTQMLLTERSWAGTAPGHEEGRDDAVGPRHPR